MRLGKNDTKRREAYPAIFSVDVPEKTVEEMREALINHGYWVVSISKK